MVLGKENNVDNTGMRFDKQARTALAFVTLRADGEREFMFFRHPSANMLLTEAELDTDLIQKISEDEIVFLTEDFHGKVGGVKDEKKLRDALRFANICGAITVTERGAIPSLPSKEVVHKKLEESENK
ncbi:unnamed protein product [Lactuca virosa]|uniref:Carbohydrate kinase PfkB domain-containing protein n=1 Tax=Lactuca virosa TaxID=75947 RepID=A0AAU9NFX1_9ASTR|nr:unnamed protein product [Lactuca virosa]